GGRSRSCGLRSRVSARADGTELGYDPAEAWDGLTEVSPPDLHWSTDNVGEAAPGVLTPLGWSFWADSGERCTRGAFQLIGGPSGEEAREPDRISDRVVQVFYGRLAIQVELMTLLGDRLPGTSGQELAEELIGTVPDDIEFRPTARRYPLIAARLPY